jgi:uroporphyrinogen decarboxylase
VTAPLLVRTLRGEPTERFPVWMMRQAGRYLPGYRAVRAKTSFLDLCRSADLTTQVSLEPVETLDVDAAIVFADILLTADAMGAAVSFDDGGPKIAKPIRSAADARTLHAPDLERTRATFEAIGKIRRALPAEKAVIGFSAAPFTLCAYLVEGGTSRDFTAVRRLLAEDRAAFEALIDRAAAALAPYLAEQARSGADALMLFDTWAGIVSPEDYRAVVARGVRGVLERLPTPRPPIVLFAGLGAGERLEDAAATGVDALSVDWRVDLADAHRRVGRHTPLQGNLDPAVLYAPPAAVARATHAMLASVPAGRSHVANLGHGILPDVPVEHARAFVTAAKAFVPAPSAGGKAAGAHISGRIAP